MATALAQGFIRAGLTTAKQLIASDPVEAARTAFSKETGGKVTTSNAEVATFANVLLLAVKPDQANGVLTEIREHFSSKHLLISIAAGVPIVKLESALGGEPRVIRVMPNTPALLGASASAFAQGKSAQPEDCALAQQLFSAVGIAFQ